MANCTNMLLHALSCLCILYFGLCTCLHVYKSGEYKCAAQSSFLCKMANCSLSGASADRRLPLELIALHPPVPPCSFVLICLKYFFLKTIFFNFFSAGRQLPLQLIALYPAVPPWASKPSVQKHCKYKCIDIQNWVFWKYIGYLKLCLLLHDVRKVTLKKLAQNNWTSFSTSLNDKEGKLLAIASGSLLICPITCH